MHSLLSKLYPDMFMSNIHLILFTSCLFQLKSQILEQASFYLVLHSSKEAPYNILLHEEQK